MFRAATIPTAVVVRIRVRVAGRGNRDRKASAQRGNRPRSKGLLVADHTAPAPVGGRNRPLGRIRLRGPAAVWAGRAERRWAEWHLADGPPNPYDYTGYATSTGTPVRPGYPIAPAAAATTSPATRISAGRCRAGRTGAACAARTA